MVTRREKQGGLSEQQERFCLEYFKTPIGYIAARRAGYTGDDHTLTVTGSQLLAKGSVVARIDELRAERAKQTKIDAAWVLDRLIDLHEKCASESEICDSRGQRTGVFQLDSRGANRALELIAKHLPNYFAQETNVVLNVTLDDIKKMSVAELRDLRAKLAGDK